MLNQNPQVEVIIREPCSPTSNIESLLFMERLRLFSLINNLKNLTLVFPKPIITDQNKLQVAGRFIAQMANLKTVTVLNSDFSNSSPASVINFVQTVSGNTTLETVNLSECNIFDLDLPTLKTLSQYKSCKLFNLYRAPNNLEFCPNKKAWYARLLFRLQVEHLSYYNQLPFKVSANLAFEILNDFLISLPSKGSAIDSFIDNADKHIETSMTA
ncbi:MAG: hypothetical protein HON32_05420 [Francisellaceae bacterium]|jgi:hypothetical protein|nr:hypothetical protein [Francisellaceae bacterium]MBT6539693.1 hypothetical protein [Francisellaceae bacterium]